MVVLGVRVRIWLVGELDAGATEPMIRVLVPPGVVVPVLIFHSIGSRLGLAMETAKTNSVR